MKTKLLYILLLVTLGMSGQTRNTLKGIVTAADAPLTGAYIINTATGAEAETDAKGKFSIAAKNGDKLAVYSKTTEERKFYVSDESFKNMPWVLAVVPKASEIEEVIVTDTVAIIQPVQGVAVKTVAERRSDIGAETKIRNMGELGGGLAVQLDPLFNGKKRKVLRSQLETERLLGIIEGIGKVYSKEDIVEILHIPAEKTEAFAYYAAEDTELAHAITSNNNDQARLLLGVLAVNYLKMQQEETIPAEPK